MGITLILASGCLAQGATGGGDAGNVLGDASLDARSSSKPRDAATGLGDVILAKMDARSSPDASSPADGAPITADDGAPSTNDASDACTLTTCAAENATCGNISDGCGSTLLCGVCASPETCGGGGSPKACGCTPTTCALAGANCGSIPDGCGETLTCGTCVVPDTCGGAGAAGVCAAPCGVLAGGSTLAAGAALASCDGRFSLEMQATDGNLVIYFSGAALWSAATAGNPGAYAAMQGDGNFVIYAGSVALWSSATGGNPGAYLSMQTDGNLVVYSSTDVSLWSSGTCCH
jgi:hypothetical protein